MKKLLLLLLVCVASSLVASAQIKFEWGTPSWNIEDGWTFDSYEDYEQTGVILTYPNPTNYTLTFFQMLAVEYLVYKDDVEVPDTAYSSARQDVAIRLSYDFLEGHSYKVVTTGAALAQANIATYTTDTLTQNSDSYQISFTIKGPELVKTINVEQNMSLAIENQDDPLTFSLIDVNEVLAALEIPSISDAAIFGLQANGAYVSSEWYGNETYKSFDGWRDADGNYTTWGGGYNYLVGHNAYPAVYSIKLNETCDTVKYYYYDYWREYNPEESDTMGGSGIVTPVKSRVPAVAGPRRAPETHYNYVIVDWYDEENDTLYQYRRNFRCDEGSDYKASFVVKTNEKYVLINATMHFVSVEDYLNPPVATKKGDVNKDGGVDISDIVAIINQIAGKSTYEKADVNEDGEVDISDIVSVINIIANGE